MVTEFPQRFLEKEIMNIQSNSRAGILPPSGIDRIRYDGFEDLLAKQADRLPDKTALICEKDGVPAPVTYRELLALSRRRAGELSRTGRACIGILCDGSADCVVTIFGAVLSGMQTVLLNENTSEELLADQIRAADVDLLWGDDELAEELAPLLQGNDETAPPGQGDLGPADGSHILFFTSGTTSRSKAVLLTDRSLMASAWNGSCMLPLTEEDILMCMLPLDHVFGCVCSLLWGLSCGCSVALGRGARHYLDDLSFFRPTVLSAVPALLAFLLGRDVINPQLRLILVGAGACPRPHLDAAAAKGIRISFGYGMTETSSGIAISVSGDPFAMEICPDDTVTIAPDGEILVKAPTCMMLGYYRRPEETARVLKDGMLYTGDLGTFDENGRLHITGRKKEILVLSDGTKIFLPEYEAQLSRVLGTEELAVLAPENSPVLLIREDPSSRSRIQSSLKDLMSTYPRGQQLTDFYFTDSPLPRTATGKLMRDSLPGLCRKDDAEG